MQYFFVRTILRIYLELSCSRLSDSGEDAKVKGTRTVGGAKKFSPVSFRIIFVFALFQFSGPDYLGTWNRLTYNILQAESQLRTANSKHQVYTIYMLYSQEKRQLSFHTATTP